MAPIGQRRTGFQERFLHFPYRKLFIDRKIAAEEDLAHLTEVDRSPPHGTSPPEEQKNVQRLEDLVNKTSGPILRVKTAIPFNPFPHEVVIDINKVTIIYRYFLASESIHSIFIKDISDVLVETSLFFATLKIVDVGFTENTIDVCYLKTKDAIQARKIIQGLIIAHKNGVDFSQFDLPDIITKLEELGRVIEGK